jgi:GAF domain-containing protein
MAIPLRVAGEVIGALDVQSTETNAFSQEDIGVLSTLADQIAIAIENARLFGETKKALSESRVMFEQYTQQEWSSFARQAKARGFVFDGKYVVAMDSNTKRESMKAVIQTGSLSREKTSASVAVPIKLRGQTIGVLDVRAKSGQRPWKSDEIALLEAAAERAALALENARLIESAQKRAARERAIGDISNRIGAVSSLESILQTAVEELGRKIGGAAEVTLELNADDSQTSG